MFLFKLTRNLKVTITCSSSTHFLRIFIDFELSNTCCRGFEQRYVKNAFTSLYLGFNESLKGFKMKYKVISFIVPELEPKQNEHLATDDF